MKIRRGVNMREGFAPIVDMSLFEMRRRRMAYTALILRAQRAK